MNKRSQELLPFYFIIFFTGFSFLVFEVSWFRMLSLVMGATVSASTLVLVSFMAGFGVGAHFWGKKATSAKRPLAMLYYLFVAIGSLGFLNYFLIGKMLPALSMSLSPFLLFLISLCILFLPAFLMGGVLPVVSRIVISSGKNLAAKVGRLYAFETLGSTVGGFLCGFLLIGSIGQKNTILVAVVVNLLLAAVLLVAKRWIQLPEEEVAPVPILNADKKGKQKKPAAKTSNPALNRQAALMAAFTCGFVVVGMQVVWLRIFRIYMTNTSYTFSLIASVVILGMFTGSWLFSRRGNKIKEYSFHLLKQLLWLGFFLLAGFFMLSNLPSLLFFPLGGLQEIHVVRIIVIPLLSSLLIIVPVTLISGYIFPMACTLYTSNYKEVSSSIGRVLLFNTLGSVAGPLMAAYVLIPYIGAALSVIAFLLILLLFALLIAFRVQSVKKLNTLKLSLTGAMIIVIMVLVVRPTVYILPPSFSKYQKKILAYKETVEGTYVVGQEAEGDNIVMSTYVNNSSVIGSTYDAIKAVKMIGHIPFFAGLKCNDALVVGFGIGVTTSAIASHPEVKSIECVELVDGLKNAAHYYSDLNNNIIDDPRLKVYSGDGRHYLQTSRKKYDLISSDPTHPILGSGSIYTQEYFELCRQHLNPGGMVSQYLPLHKLRLQDFMGIIKTFHSVFPDATVWIGHYHAILIGSNGNMKIDFAQWTENIKKSAKDIYFYTNPYHVAACLVLDSAQIEKLTRDIKINTDDCSYVEFFSFSSFDSDNLVKNLKYLSENRGGLYNVFRNIPDRAMMERFIRGNMLLTEGLHSFLQDDMAGYRKKLEAACAANPEDEEFPFLIKFHFR
ncbi:MAG: fused MFS/spermidine synthase [Bacteroidota bacterium]